VGVDPKRREGAPSAATERSARSEPRPREAPDDVSNALRVFAAQLAARHDDHDGVASVEPHLNLASRLCTREHVEDFADDLLRNAAARAHELAVARLEDEQPPEEERAPKREADPKDDRDERETLQDHEIALAQSGPEAEYRGEMRLPMGCGGVLLLLAACSTPAQNGGDASTASTTDVSPTGTAPPRASASNSPTAQTATAIGDVTSAPSGEWRDVKTADYEGAVAPDSESLPYGEKSDARWPPDDAAIARAEGALPAAVAKEPRAKRIAPKLKAYKRQYFGFTSGSKRQIYVNAFCSELDDLKKRIVMVKDGGDCFFQAIYDESSKAIVRLSINGEG
jgi:hypothetical protein